MLNLAFLLLAPVAGVELPGQHHGAITARMSVCVMEQGIGPGRGRVRYHIIIEGPPTMEVDGPRLEDALAAWRIEWQTMSSGDHWETMMGLGQLKPGAAPLPGLRLRVRERPSDDWHDIAWLDPLHEPRDVAPLVALPALPASRWPGEVLLIASMTILLVLFMFLGVRYARRRTRRGILQPPEQLALERIEAGGGVEAFVAATRAFLQEQSGLPIARPTSGEVLELVGEQKDLRALLELGDLVKYAGLMPSSDQVEQAREQARRVVQTWATGQGTKKSPIGEER